MPPERKVQTVDWFQRTVDKQGEYKLSQVDWGRNKILQQTNSFKSIGSEQYWEKSNSASNSDRRMISPLVMFNFY